MSRKMLGRLVLLALLAAYSIVVYGWWLEGNSYHYQERLELTESVYLIK